MAFDLQDLSGLEKRFEHIPTVLTQRVEGAYDAHKTVVDQLVSTAKNLLTLVPYGQEAESFVTKLAAAGEEIHTAIDKVVPPGSVVANDVVAPPAVESPTGAAPVAEVGTPAPVAPVVVDPPEAAASSPASSTESSTPSADAALQAEAAYNALSPEDKAAFDAAEGLNAS